MGVDLFYYLSVSEICPDKEGWPLVGVDLFYYLSVSEICSDKRGGLWWEWTYKRGTTIFYNLNAM